MAFALWKACMRSQVKELSIIVRSPSVLHKCITKRYIEFKFFPEKPLEEGNTFNKNDVLFYFAILKLNFP